MGEFLLRHRCPKGPNTPYRLFVSAHLGCGGDSRGRIAPAFTLHSDKPCSSPARGDARSSGPTRVRLMKPSLEQLEGPATEGPGELPSGGWGPSEPALCPNLGNLSFHEPSSAAVIAALRLILMGLGSLNTRTAACLPGKKCQRHFLPYPLRVASKG